MLDQLNPRERLFVMAGGFLLGLLIVIFLGYKISQMRGGIAQRVAQERENVLKIGRLKDDINSLPSPQSLPDMNEFISQTNALLEKYKMKPQDLRERTDTSSRTEEMLVNEISLNGVALKDIIGFIHDIEYGKRVNASIGGLIFRKSLPGKEIYDVKITLVIRKPKVRIQ